MKRQILSVFLISFSIAAVYGPVFGQKRPGRRTPPQTIGIRNPDVGTPVLPHDQQLRVDAFLKAWRTLNDYYFDKTFNGLDWNKVREEYLSRATAAKSNAEVYRLIEEMVAKLDKSHFGLIPPEFFANLKAARDEVKQREREIQARDGQGKAPAVVKDEESPDVNSRYGIGVELRMINGKFVITSVEPQSGAIIAGLKPGYIVEKVNGMALSELTGRLLIAYPNIRHLERYLPTQLSSLFLNGDKDTYVFLTCVDENEQVREYKVPRLSLGGEVVTIGQRLPPQFLRFHTASLTDDVGYIKFNVFGMPVIGKFCDALTEFATKKAIIVDLRGNIGGLLGTLVALSGMLTDRDVTIGTSLYRYRSEIVAAKPKAKNYKGNVVFLVDNQTMSAAELFSAGLQENGRVLVVGDKTAGEALPAGSVELPTGAVLVYPMANFRTNKGKYIEGNGVEPNYLVALDRRTLLDGQDVQLNKALELIKDGTAFPKPMTMEVHVSEFDALPPPPKATRQGSGIGAGNGKLASIAPPPAAKPPVKDPRALQVISDFTAAIGGVEAAKKMASYEATGSAILSNAGSDTSVIYHVYRQPPEKYAVIMDSPVIGEIREVHNGKDVLLQSDYGIDTTTAGFDASRTHLFSPLTTLTQASTFKTLSYLGEFDDHGRRLRLVQGTIDPGVTVAMSFDSRTNLLVRCSMAMFSYTLGDYRKVDTLMLPFAINIEGLIDVKLDSVKLGTTIDPANFQRKERCFDKPLKTAH